MKYYCSICNYDAKDNFNLQKHYQTNKHMKNKNLQTKAFDCSCKKSFSYKSSLLRHQKKCIFFIKQNTIDIIALKQEVENLKMKLEETQNQLITTNNNTQNITNNTVNNNINFNFNYTIKLHEKFPDALSMDEFIKLMEDSCGDLTKMATKPSFINQVARMIYDKISELDTENRPLHFITNCGEDSFYMKEGENWDKASNEKIGNRIEFTARCLSKIHFFQWEDILNNNEGESPPDEWTKQIKHVTQAVTQEELDKGVSKLKKVTSLNKKLLAN